MTGRTNTATRPRRTAGVLRSVSEEQVVRRESAIETVHAIARREAAGKTQDGDANGLAGALAQAGITQDEYCGMVGICETRAQLVLGASDEKAIVAMSAARRALKDHDAKKRQLSDAEPPLVVAFNRAQAELGAAHKTGEQLAELEFEHALLLGVTPPPTDLDGFQLVNPNDSVNVFDPDTPTMHVPRDVVRRESERRYYILDVVRQRAHDLNARAYSAWRDKGEAGVTGWILPKGKEPDPIKVTWRWVCETYTREQRDALAVQGADAVVIL